jgi:hypothetical protein
MGCGQVAGYPAILPAMSISGMRARLPLVVFILLLIVALLLLGFACACLSDHPIQAIERVLAAIPAVPPVVEVWSVNALGLAMLMLLAGRYVRAVARPSPATLQRFLL